MGPAPLGFAYFAAVKLAGYTLAGHRLRRVYRTETPKPLVFGLARTALGVLAGLAFAAIAWKVGVGRSEVLYYVLLAPIRFAEWVFILWLLFDRRPASIGRLLALAAVGSLWSYVLDIPAIFAVFTLPGGAWIC
ncbi:MAG TPA: hypothetical protein VIV57_22190 [Anaeromyxobacter sp.]